MKKINNFLALMTARAITHGDKKIIGFITDDQYEVWNYRELDQRARSIAAHIQEFNKPGDRILILLPVGLDYVAAYLACLYTDCIAIPLFPPRNNRENDRMLHLSTDADCHTAIVNSATNVAAIANFNKIQIEQIKSDANQYIPIKIKSEDIAYLQYTSGSTSSPKGVIVTHDNLLANCQAIENQFYTPEIITMGCSWLPPYHDMGLIGGILFPLYSNFQAVLFSPYRFIQTPLFWLQVISDYRANITLVPNFACDMIAKELPKSSDLKLDLTCLKVIVNGSEPVHAASIKNFSMATKPYGLKDEVIYPSYGLAEATLLITARNPAEKNKILKIDKESLTQQYLLPTEDPVHEYLEIVSCGQVLKNHQLIIVDPSTKRILKPWQTGEIWINGPSITKGYWQKDQETQQTYQAYPKNKTRQAVAYLRTGDLGFLDNEQHLYVAGRIKDLIIIRGKNYYPHDIEYAIQHAHPSLIPHGGAAIGLTHNHQEYLTVIQEIARHVKDFDEIFIAIQNCIMQEYEITVERILLIQKASLPKTSSGKVKRYACKEALKNNSLKILAKWESPRIREDIVTTKKIMPSKITESDKTSNKADSIINWLRDYTERRINSRLMDERRSLFPYIIIDLAKHGLFGMQIQQAYGGLELSFKDMHRIMQQLAAIDPSLAVLVGTHVSLGASPIHYYGTAELKDRLLPDMASGRALGAMGITEPGCGSHLGAITSTAMAIGKNKWKINGIKRWNASGWAHVINVVIQLVDQNNNFKGLTGFVVTQDMPGVKIGPQGLTIGWRSIAQTPVYFEDVLVDKTSILGEPGKGMDILHKILTLSRVGVATVSLGVMKRAMQLMLRFSSRREITSGLLSENKVLLDFVTEITTKITFVETLTNFILAELDAGVEIPMEVAMIAKIMGSEYAWQTVDLAIQMTGGRGCMENNILPQLLRDCRAFRIVEGSNEPLAVLIGRAALQSETITYFLEHSLQAQHLATQLKTIEKKLINLIIEHHKSVDYDWLFYVVGMITCLYVTRGTIEQKLKFSNDETLKFSANYLENISENYCEKLFRFIKGTKILKANKVKNIINHYKTAIGDIEQHSYDEDRELDPLFAREWQESPSTNKKSKKIIPVTQLEIQNWIHNWVKEKLDFDSAMISVNTRFIELGLDSLYLVRLAHDIETKFSVTISTALILLNPTIEQLSHVIEEAMTKLHNQELVNNGQVTKEQAEKLLLDIDNLSEEQIEKLLNILEKPSEQ